MHPSLTIKLFGPQAQLVGKRELVVTPAELTVGSVLSAISQTYPELASTLSVSRLAVNQDWTAPEDPVRASDELALIGMVSGG